MRIEISSSYPDLIGNTSWPSCPKLTSMARLAMLLILRLLMVLVDLH